mmetsp:Transcript_52279/g.148005  ORF Transcript_52279/g.148005 Transcript_52279/m.148005 type:complete len:210 (+) Transcript_52279:475-1104(+)
MAFKQDVIVGRRNIQQDPIVRAVPFHGVGGRAQVGRCENYVGSPTAVRLEHDGVCVAPHHPLQLCGPPLRALVRHQPAREPPALGRGAGEKRPGEHEGLAAWRGASVQHFVALLDLQRVRHEELRALQQREGRDAVAGGALDLHEKRILVWELLQSALEGRILWHLERVCSGHTRRNQAVFLLKSFGHDRGQERVEEEERVHLAVHRVM